MAKYYSIKFCDLFRYFPVSGIKGGPNFVLCPCYKTLYIVDGEWRVIKIKIINKSKKLVRNPSGEVKQQGFLWINGRKWGN